MYPRSLDAFVLLRGFVRPLPVALSIPLQRGEGVRESGWRLGRGERLAKFVQGHGHKPSCKIDPRKCLFGRV